MRSVGQTVFIAYLAQGSVEIGLDACKTQEGAEELIWGWIDEHLHGEMAVERFGRIQREDGHRAAIDNWLDDPFDYYGKEGGDYWMIKEVKLK